MDSDNVSHDKQTLSRPPIADGLDVCPPDFGPDFQNMLADLLAWRRDVRHFRRDPLPDGALERLIAYAGLAPSVGNAQPWRFSQITDHRAALADLVDTASEEAARSYDPERASAYRSLKLHGLREAPEVLAVWSDETPEAGHGLGIHTMAEMLRYSTVMAIHTLWLCARAQGIGFGWVSILNPFEVSALLEAPSNWTLIAVICLGYPEQHSPTPELEQKGWQAREAIHFDRK